eukprot:jgi/Mesen1/4126/ME000218S03244
MCRPPDLPQLPTPVVARGNWADYNGADSQALLSQGNFAEDMYDEDSLLEKRDDSEEGEDLYAELQLPPSRRSWQEQVAAGMLKKDKQQWAYPQIPQYPPFSELAHRQQQQQQEEVESPMNNLSCASNMLLGDDMCHDNPWAPTSRGFAGGRPLPLHVAPLQDSTWQISPVRRVRSFDPELTSKRQQQQPHQQQQLRMLKALEEQIGEVAAPFSPATPSGSPTCSFLKHARKVELSPKLECQPAVPPACMPAGAPLPIFDLLQAVQQLSAPQRPAGFCAPAGVMNRMPASLPMPAVAAQLLSQQQQQQQQSPQQIDESNLDSWLKAALAVNEQLQAQTAGISAAAAPAAQKAHAAAAWDCLADVMGMEAHISMPGGAQDEGDHDPATEEKKTRRMLSNRASAKRSRQRRQDRLHELEILHAQSRVDAAATTRQLDDALAQTRAAREQNAHLAQLVVTLQGEERGERV